jgi:hypothetical protein
MRRAHGDERENLVYVVRGFLGYLCLIILFGGVILIVQASMEVKRIRYQLTDANLAKVTLLEELQKLDNRISEMERYSRIAEMVSGAMPLLGPPRHPAIELVVPGLQKRSGPPETPVDLLQDHSPLARLRDGWKSLRETVHGWLRSIIE